MKRRKNPAPGYKSRAAKLVALGKKVDDEKKLLWKKNRRDEKTAHVRNVLFKKVGTVAQAE